MMYFPDMLACLMLFGFIRVGQKLIFDPRGLQEKIEVEKITKRAGLEGWEKSECQKLMPFKKWCEFFSLTTNVDGSLEVHCSLSFLCRILAQVYFSQMIKELIFHTIYKTLKNTSVVGSEIIRKTMLYLLSMPENRDILQQNIWRFQRLIKLCYYALKSHVIW